MSEQASQGTHLQPLAPAAWESSERPQVHGESTDAQRAWAHPPLRASRTDRSLCTQPAYAIDRAFERALRCAVEAGEQAWGTTSPNPPVGAAVLAPDGRICGIGHTQPPGQAHAEVQAIAGAGEQTHGATLVVTLEPCHHHGRTGPCSEAVLSAGISRVVFCQRDPGKLEGGGARWLQQHGVEVICLDVGVAALRPWLAAQRLGRPYVVGKSAHSLDGKIAAPDGTSQWITGEQARAFAHVERTRHDAIVVGTGTVLADNPRLSARVDGCPQAPQPRRVVVGSRAIPRGYHLDDPSVLRAASLEAALTELWDAGARSVLLEGGPTLLISALRAGLLDELHSYEAPCLLGGTHSAFGQGCLDADELSVASEVPSTQRVAGAGAGAAVTGRGSLVQAPRFRLDELTILGGDTLKVLVREEG